MRARYVPYIHRRTAGDPFINRGRRGYIYPEKFYIMERVMDDQRWLFFGEESIHSCRLRVCGEVIADETSTVSTAMKAIVP